MDLFGTTKQKMDKVLEMLKSDLATIRTGRATPSLVENVVVPVYGGSTKLRIMELATITASDASTLLLTPFDSAVIDEMKKGILEANIGLTPSVDGGVIRISIPPLSGERREQLIKLMNQKLENGRIMIRQIRHDSMSDVKKQVADKEISEDEQGRQEKDVQKLTDDATEQIKLLGQKKEEELTQL